MNKHCILLALVFVPIASTTRADYIVNVTLNTSALTTTANSSQGPFAIDFQLNDGSVSGGNGNNTATISNLNLNGGSLGSVNPLGAPSGSDVSGTLTSTLSITDAGSLGGFNDFNQAFTPGSSLSFTLDLTTSVSTSEGNGTGSPDQFSFAVYSNGGASLASLLTIDITGANPAVTTSGGSLGNGALVPAPNVAAVPEPSTFALLTTGIGLLALGTIRRRGRRQLAA
jgi:hypothetical protein